MKFALLILLISTSLFFQSEAVVTRFEVTGAILCKIPNQNNAIKAVEFWEWDGYWPFTRLGDDHLEANITYYQKDSQTYPFRIESNIDGGDGIELVSDYEPYIRVLNSCTPDGREYWADFSLWPDTFEAEERTLWINNQYFDVTNVNHKRSVTGRKEHQH
ncbi:unnamed protein product [Caenorhabditis nigoni]